MANRIYTRTGDMGETGLAEGQRRPKHDVRIEAIGAVDEANAAIGLVRSIARDADRNTDVLMRQVQQDLFEIGAELAGSSCAAGVLSGRIRWLERGIDEMAAEVEPLTAFVLPGGCEIAGRLHVARAAVRRAERTLVSLANAKGGVRQPMLAYMNRLSDFLFMAARIVNQKAGIPDELWKRPELG